MTYIEEAFGRVDEMKGGRKKGRKEGRKEGRPFLGRPCCDQLEKRRRDGVAHVTVAGDNVSATLWL